MQTIFEGSRMRKICQATWNMSKQSEMLMEYQDSFRLDGAKYRKPFERKYDEKFLILMNLLACDFDGNFFFVPVKL